MSRESVLAAVTSAIASLHGVATRPERRNLLKVRAEIERVYREREELIKAGKLLSNCAFNLAQCERLTPDERRSLRESYEAWDKARTGAQS